MEAELKVRVAPEVDAKAANGALRALADALLKLTSTDTTVDVDASQVNAALRDVQTRARLAVDALHEIEREGSASAKSAGEGFDEVSGKAEKLNGTLGRVRDSIGHLGLAALGGGLLAAGHAAVGANAEMETLQTQLATAIKGTRDFKEKYKDVTDPLQLQAAAAKEAQIRVAELAKFGAETPFDLPGIGKAEKVLVGFGLTGSRALQLTGKNATELRTIIGDVSAGTGVDFAELSVTLGKFSTGASGEAISRLQEIGAVTKEELRAAGVQFDKAGSLTSPLDKALTATVSIMQSKFGGGMQQLSSTFEGQMSTLKDNAEGALRTLGTPIFTALRSTIGTFNDVLNSDAVQGAVAKVGEAIAPIATLLTTTLAKVVPAISALIGPVADTLITLLGPITEIIGSVVGSLANLLTGIAGPLGNLLKVLAGAVVALVEPLISALLPILDQIVGVLGPLIALVANLAATFIPVIQVALLPAVTVLTILAKVVAAVVGALGPLVGTILQAFASVLLALQPALLAIADLLSKVANLIGQVFAGALTIGLRVVTALATGLGHLIAQFVSSSAKGGALAQVMKLVHTVVNAASQAFTYLKGVVGGASEAFQVIKETINDFLTALSSFDIVAALKAFAGFGDKIATAYKRGFDKATHSVEALKEETATPPETPQTPPPATSGTSQKKADETEFQRAKRLFELEQTRTNETQKRKELASESARIEARHEKTVVDDVILEKERTDVLKSQLAFLERQFRVGKDGRIGISLKKEEIKDAEKLIGDLRNQVTEQVNKVGELRLKLLPELDNEKLRSLERDRLKLDVELGIRDESDLVTFVEGDVAELQKKLTKLTEHRIGELADARQRNVISEEEFQAAILRVQRQGEEGQLSLQNQIITKQKELRDLQYSSELKALEKSEQAKQEILKRASDIEARFLDNLLKLVEQAGKIAIDRQAKEHIDDLDRLRHVELMSEEEFERRRERIEQRISDPTDRLRQLKILEDARNGELASQERVEAEKLAVQKKAERQQAALQERTRAQRVEADRQAALQSLQIQQEQLTQRLALAMTLGKADEVDAIGSQLDAVTEQIRTKGSILSGLTEDLQSDLTEGLTNLFAGNDDEVKQPFRKAFAALAGGLQRLATAKIVEVLLGSLSGLGGIPGMIVAFAARPVIEALVNGILGPVIDGLLSFSTGGRIDQPTLAIVGDGARLGGSDREWIFRDDQLKAVMREVAGGAQNALLEELRATRGAMEEMTSREWRLSGTDIVTATDRTRAARRRRQLNGPR